MVSIRSLFARGTGAPKPFGAAPRGKRSEPSGKDGTYPHAVGKPGDEAPHHLQYSGPEGKPKSSWGDKLSMGANVVGAGASIYPMVQGMFHKDPKPHQPANGANGEPKIEDRELYNQMSVLTAVGPTPINW